MEAKRYDVDIICQYSKEGNIIPLRIRVVGDDGEPRVFNIDSYKELSGNGTYTTNDGVYVTNRTIFFECKIDVDGSTREIRLYYRECENNWFITA